MEDCFRRCCVYAFYGYKPVLYGYFKRGASYKIEGKVKSIRQKKYHRSGTIKNRVIISINQNTYFLVENSDIVCYELCSDINTGDSITIFHRTFGQSMIGTGSEFQIMAIKSNGISLYPLSRTSHNYIGLSLLFTIGSSILGLAYFVSWRRLRRRLRKSLKK